MSALEAGREAEALGGREGHPPASPHADWKLLVRGLAAYYRQDAVEMAANLDRLDPERFAVRIARPLRALADPDRSQPLDPRTAAAVVRLGSRIAGGPVLETLHKLQSRLADGHWQDAVQLFRRGVPLFRHADPALPTRLMTILRETFCRKGEPRPRCRVLAAVVEVLSSHGDTHLGGDDFDQLLLDLVCDDFQREHGVDLRQSLAARSRVLRAVEEAKKRLSVGARRPRSRRNSSPRRTARRCTSAARSAASSTRS